MLGVARIHPLLFKGVIWAGNALSGGNGETDLINNQGLGGGGFAL